MAQLSSRMGAPLYSVRVKTTPVERMRLRRSAWSSSTPTLVTSAPEAVATAVSASSVPARSLTVVRGVAVQMSWASMTGPFSGTRVGSS